MTSLSITSLLKIRRHTFTQICEMKTIVDSARYVHSWHHWVHTKKKKKSKITFMLDNPNKGKYNSEVNANESHPY